MSVDVQRCLGTLKCHNFVLSKLIFLNGNVSIVIIFGMWAEELTTA